MTFRILAAQMRALGRQTQSRFLAKMGDYLRANMPEHVAEVGSERLDGWLAGALAIAHANGIETEPEAAQLILLLTVLGLDAERRHDWFSAALEDETLLPVGKLIKIIVEGRDRVPELERVVVYPQYREALDRPVPREIAS